MIIAWTALAVFLSLGVICAHEAGHWLAFRDAGIGIRRVGIGLPFFPPRFTFRTRWGIEVGVTPWLLGAWVEPDASPEQVSALPFRLAAWTSGAGVIVNLAAAAGILAAAAAVQGYWLAAVIYVAAAAVIWTVRRYLVLAVPLLGAAITVWATWLLAGDLRTGKSGGVAGLPSLLVSHTPAAALTTAAVVSVGVSLINMIPLLPMDGGHIARAAILAWRGQRAADRFAARSALAGLLLAVALPLLTDVLHLAGR
jgi:membrane-associated protease RseP (regulator of RpoE activity)